MTRKRHDKVRGIIKCFLVLNEGVWFTSRDIATFLSSHNFGLGNYYISSHKIGRLISDRDKGLFSDIEIETKWNRKRYRYNGND